MKIPSSVPANDQEWIRRKTNAVAHVALRRMDVWKLRMFMLATPVLAAVIEWPLMGIELSMLQCLGGAIILAALALLIQMEWRLSTTADDDAAAWNADVIVRDTDELAQFVRKAVNLGT